MTSGVRTPAEIESVAAEARAFYKKWRSDPYEWIQEVCLKGF
jgi:hypothetical protein